MFSSKEAEFYERFLKQSAEWGKNPNQGVGSLVEELARNSPDRVALYFRDDSWTWQVFNEESNKIANCFLKLGMEKNDSIALMSRNSPEFLFILAGINKIGSISGLINYNQKKQALTHSIKRVNPKYIIVGGESLPSFFEIIENIPQKNDQIFVINNTRDIPHDFQELSVELDSISSDNPKTTPETHLDQVAYYIFSSGTTGLPKAIKIKNRKLFSGGYFMGKSLVELTPDDVVYIPTPLYHNLAIGHAWMVALVSGAATALAERFSPSNFWKDVQKYKATYTAYVGEIPRYLLNQPPSEFEKNTPLKYMVGVGLRKETWERFKARFDVENIYEYYGTTESHRVFINIDGVPGMIGRHIIPGIDLAKVNPETGEFYKNPRGFHVKCKPGDIGMVLVKLADRHFFGTYKDEEKTKKKMIFNVFRRNDCYFNMGDLVKLHEDKWLSFHDRTGDTFRWKSENVSTAEVEHILNSHPPILFSTVYGVAIPNTEGKAGMAAIKLNPSLKFEMDSFSRFISEVLPNYSIPIFVRICNELELTGGTLKIKKFNLRKEAYDVKTVKDPLFFWDSFTKNYVPLDDLLYQRILSGQIKI